MTVTVDVYGSGSRSADGDAPGLMSRYQDYVERKVASSLETREIYDRLLRRVASGELDPKTLDRGLNSFLQINGPEYAKGVADLSMRFLAGIVQAASRDSYELFDEVASGTLEPPPEPLELDPTDWADWVPRLIEAAEQAREAPTNALRVVLGRVASGELDPEAVERMMLERSRQQIPASVTRLAGLYIEMLTGLEEANTAFGMDYLRSVARRDAQADSIELGGGLGDSVQVRFVVTNDEPVDAAMRCAIVDLRREDGIGPAFEPEVTITPDHFELAPDTDVQVACSLLLTDIFVPGVTYVGELLILTDTETVAGDPPAHPTLGTVGRVMTEPNDPIAIIGMRGRFPGADDLDDFWRNLADGVESITPLSREDMRSAGDPRPRHQPARVRQRGPAARRRRHVRRRLLRLLGARRGPDRSAAPTVPRDRVGGARGRRLRPRRLRRRRSACSAVASSAPTCTSCTRTPKRSDTSTACSSWSPTTRTISARRSPIG